MIASQYLSVFHSLKYHKLHPNYVYERLKILGKAFLGRFLLVQVDTKDHTKVLRELTRISFLLNFTLVLAWSIEEAGRYIETLKAYETKTPDSIKEKPAESDAERVTRALTSIKGVNSTDAYTMALNFKTFADIANADKGSLQMCPGLGAQKVNFCSILKCLCGFRYGGSWRPLMSHLREISKNIYGSSQSFPSYMGWWIVFHDGDVDGG